MTQPDKVVSGLEGILAFESDIAFIDGDKPELSYRGYDIADVARNLSYEATTYLLWHGSIPSATELAAFTASLAAQRAVPDAVLAILKQAPASAHPMAVLRTSVSMLGALDPDADNIAPDALLRKATALTAQFPTIVAAQVRLQAGQQPVAPDASLGHAANYHYMVTGTPPDDITARTFDTALVLYAEHETNASTFAARVVAGTQSDYYSALVAGIGAIKGPLHGGAIDGAMQMLVDIGTPDNAAAYVDAALAAKRKLSGFGHRVYRAGDPRAAQLRLMAEKMADAVGDRRWLDVALAAEKRMSETKGIIPNVDYFAGPVLYQLG
ncbi:MAG: citrate synthase, partial [Chloroflexi bacterium]|nr:citrate synthase [Chloroflexota bacterium]